VDRVVSGGDGGGYNTKHVAKYFRMFFTANGQLHFDGVINLKGAGTRAKRKKGINKNEECRGVESRPRINRQEFYV